MALGDLAARLTTAASGVTGAASVLPVADPGAAAFGGEATGRLGDLGRELHRAYAGALDSRIREAASISAALTGLADDVSRAAARYAAADESAAHRYRDHR